MRIRFLAAIGILGLSACNPAPKAEASPEPVQPETQTSVEAAAPAPAPTSAAAPSEGAGFTRADPALGSLTLRREGELWRVSLRAGGLPRGGATAADCELQAVGPQDANDLIKAQVVPFTGALNDLTPADIGAQPPVIEVQVGPEGAFVKDAGAAARFCGLGSDIDGFYRRTDTPD